MSNEKKGYLGKDGRRYNDLWEVWNADTVVENNEKQTTNIFLMHNLKIR